MIEGSLNRNFRQYGELKSRCIAQAVESSSQSTKDAIVSQSQSERRYICAINVREVTKCCVFSMIRVSGQSKSRPVKAAGAEVRWSEAEIKNCTPLWRKAHFEVKMYKTRQVRSTFWSSDVEKLHAAVARSTFRSQNVKKLRVSGALFEVLMSKNCTPLWRKAHLASQNVKKLRIFGALFEVLMSKNCTPLWRKAHLASQNVKKLRVFGALFEVLMSKNCTPLWRKAHYQVKMYKTRQQRTVFWSSDVEKLVR